eukprot:2470198-Prymnesium_polylepis.1
MPYGAVASSACMRRVARPARTSPPPKADTDVQTHPPVLESWSVHAVSAAPECPFIGRDDPAANN